MDQKGKMQKEVHPVWMKLIQELCPKGPRDFRGLNPTKKGRSLPHMQDPHQRNWIMVNLIWTKT